MIKDVVFLWCFACPFLLITLALSWKATRGDSVFEREEERFLKFKQQHMLLWNTLTLAGIVGSVWVIGAFLYRVVSWAYKMI